MNIAGQAEQILTAVFAINQRLKGRVDIALALALSDVKSQMSGLIYRGFVTGNGWKRLGGYPALPACRRAPVGKTVR